jgi:hypothetical protein
MTTSTATTITTTERLDSDGDVVAVPAARLWDVYQQQWVTVALDSISDEVLASLPADERATIAAAR